MPIFKPAKVPQPLTEDQIANRIIDVLIDDNPYWWNGIRWKACKSDEIIARISQQIAAMDTELTLSQRLNLATNIRRSATLRQPMPERASGIYCENGVYEIEDGVFYEHSRHNYNTDYFKVNYRPEADTSDWTSFLADVFPDQECIDWFQRFCGAILLGQRSDKILVVVGEGGTGKGTIMEAVAQIVGAAPKPFSCTATTKSIQLAIQEKSMLLIDEGSDGIKLKTEILKFLTDSPFIEIDKKFLSVYSVRNRCNVVITSNEMPEMNSFSSAESRRFVCIPFDNVPKTLDRSIKPHFKSSEQQSAILNWMIEGARIYKEHGIGLNPSVVESENMKLARDANSATQFASEVLRKSKNRWLKKRDLYETYKEYCEENGQTPFSMIRFGKRLAKLMKLDTDVRIQEGKGHKVWVGVSYK